MGQRRRDHLPLLSQGAGEQVHVMLAGVVGHGQPRAESLVIGVCVNEEQPGTPVGLIGAQVLTHRTDTVARSTVPKSAWLSM